jgi:phage-related protein (TIGR01555 family)
MMNKYGTIQDNSTHYHYAQEGIIPDMELTEQYETNGLFAKIIDAPAEEAVKHGFTLGLKNQEVQEYIDDMLDMLEWEDKASTGIKWARLYGGAIGVLFINDGGGLDEPLNWKRIRDIDEIRIYARAIVYPDYSSLYNYDPRDPTKNATSKFGMPEYYQVNSIYGQFWVHESRCLVFRNGILPERTMNPYYRFWGMPEFIRVKRELREAVTTHSLGVKLLERSVQAIYSMQGLARLLSTDDGENEVIKRLQVIDLARGLLNSIAIDSEGENYDFKTATMTGVKEIIDSTCNMLSSVTNIPQTVLFGRSPAGMNSTGRSDLENWYNYVERYQKLMLRANLRTLLDVIVRVGMKKGKLTEEPLLKLAFNPLWSMSESEQAQIEAAKIQAQLVKAQTAQLYVDMGALDPTEVRNGLAQEEEFAVEELLDGIEGVDIWGGEGLPASGEAVNPVIEPDKNIRRRDENPLLQVVPPDRMIAGNLSNDGGPGSGRYPKGSGGLSNKDKAKYDRRILGRKTSTGTEIKSFSDHAYQRLAQRRISPKRMEDMLEVKPIQSKTNPNADLYRKNGAEIVLDRTNGKIVTIMWT